MRISSLVTLAATIVVAASSYASAQIRITEYTYQSQATPGNDGEFVEFTNMGASSVDMTGWSFDDNTRVAGSQSLSGFGVVAPHESVIMTSTTPTIFRTGWGLGPSVKVVGGNTNNLSRADEINIYDASSALIDRLTYDDQTFAGTPRTQEVTANIPFASLGTQNSFGVVVSSNGDIYGSHASTGGAIGNPGLYPTPVPEPTSIALALMGGAIALIAGRRRVLGKKA